MPVVVQENAEAVGETRKRIAAAEPTRSTGDGRRYWRLFVSANVLGLICFATALRCRDLGNLPGINGDEAWYGVQAELCLRGEPIPWRTPSGNLLNPLFFGPQLALHAIFPPSFALLRATAVVSGLLALAVNFWFCRHVFRRTLAIVSTVVLAVLPIDIAYSRLAWDASQSLLATLPCVYLPLWAIVNPRLKMRCSIGAVAALAIAILVHPTNLFVAPVATICLGYAWRAELRRICSRIFPRREAPGRRIGIVATSGGVVAVSLALIAVLALHPAWLRPTLARIASPTQYAEFAANLGRLFSGATVYEYLSGALAPPVSAATSDGVRWDCLPFDIATWIIGLSLAWGLYRSLGRHRPELVCLAIGWIASLFAFFVVAGPGALAPHFERYAIWIVAPTAILASAPIVWWQTRPRLAGRSFTIVSIALGWALLFGFQADCLDFMRQTGGESHQTFRTAAVEPKQAALAAILARRDPRNRVRIVTSQWWIYWPMRYLSLSRRFGQIDVPVAVEMQPATRLSVDADAAGTWRVEFTDSEACQATREAAHLAGESAQETTIADFAGRPILTLFAFHSATVSGNALAAGVPGSKNN